jgi:hypothetical protein
MTPIDAEELDMVDIEIDWNKYPKLAAAFVHRPAINVYWIELRKLLRDAFEQGRLKAQAERE